MQGKISPHILITKVQVKMTLQFFHCIKGATIFKMKSNIGKISSDTKLFQKGVYAENRSNVQIISLSRNLRNKYCANYKSQIQRKMLDVETNYRTSV